MSKRRADTYLIKGHEQLRPDDESENDRDKIDPVEIATEEVMASRKYHSQNMCIELLLIYA